MERSANARFEALYRTHQAAVTRCVARLGVPPEAWPDILQEVWITAARRLDSLEAHPRAVAWLCSVARNHALHHCRSTARSLRKARAITVEPAREHDDPFGDRDAWDTLKRLLAAVPPEQREVYVKIELHGMSASDVAEELGISVHTVNSRLRLTRIRLRESGPALITALLLLRARIAEGADGGREDAFGAAAATSASRVVGSSPWLAGISGKAALVGLLILSPSSSRPVEQHEAVSPASPTLRRPSESPASVHPRLYRPWLDDPPASGHDVEEDRASKPELQSGTAPAGRRAARPGPKPRVHNDGQELLRDVDEAYRSGRYAEALALALVHRKNHPDSQLREPCAIFIIRALCMMGDVRRARERVREFARESPDSFVFRARLAKLPNECR